jgi:anti-sigma regulatory factor (Ser/Thr protein kinase)
VIRVVRTFPPSATSLAPARQFLVETLQFADVAPELVDDCRIVLTEAFTNAVVHAYDHPDGAVEVGIVVEPDGIVEIVVSDDGVGWRLDSTSRQGGRGMGVIRSLTRRTDVSRRPHGGTEVRMWLDDANLDFDP